MPETDSFWDFYWEMRLQEMENLGKRAAILAVSRLVRSLEADARPVRLLELGCGEGQIIGALVEAHAGAPGIQESVGVDYVHQSVETCRRRYPSMTFIEGDITVPALLAGLGTFEIVLLVNTLHEIFSAGYSAELGEVDVPRAKERVALALAGAVGRIAPGGYLALFDGLEPPGDPQATLRVRFLHPQARADFETFARQYHPFRIEYQPTRDPACIELSRRHFTRYITKSIFLGKHLWPHERLESYQYFREDEFRAAIAAVGLESRSLTTLTVNEEKWSRLVEIETPGVSFPIEHILILAQKAAHSPEAEA